MLASLPPANLSGLHNQLKTCKAICSSRPVLTHWEQDAFKEAFTLKFYGKAATEITGSQTYGAGIGFSSIVFDEASDNYSYYLDTGAHIEFDKNGTLVAPRGERGPKGDKGADGGSKVPVGRPSGSLPDGSIWIA